MVFTKSCFHYFSSLGTYFGSLFTSFRPQGPHLASLGPLLAPSGAPFGPPWGHFGTPWPPFGGALAHLGANSGHLGPPGHLLERFFTEFHGFFMNSGEYSWYSMHLFSHIFLKICLSFLQYFQSLLAFPMHPCLRAPVQLRIQDGRGGMRGAIESKKIQAESSDDE